ncbi:MAG: B12-binding domain-containing radical SAM protein [Deltaproteobacteria bacterium]|nr:B12-binding domain-containing radical SAM protein [Deltaproteobacteria bacterium]
MDDEKIAAPADFPVVLVAPPVWAVKTPPLTVTLVGAYAASKGYDVNIIDLNIRLYHELASRNKDNIRLWHLSNLSLWYEEDEYKENLYDLLNPAMEKCSEEILSHEPKVVGITLNGIRSALHLAREIRKRNTDVWLVAGGQYAQPMIWGEMVALSGLFQYVVVGEGELTFYEILERCRKGLPPEPIKGTIVHNDKDYLKIGEPRELISDLDSLPFPLYDDIDPEMYVVEYEEPPFVPSRAFSILSSRGCINRCDFCIQHVIWRDRIRLRSPKSVADEIEWLVKRFGIEELNFNDLLINPSPKRLEALTSEIIGRGLKVVLNGDMTIDDRLDQALAGKLRAAGFRNVMFGIESASRKVIHAMGKHYDSGQAENVLKRVNKAGLKAWCSLIVGHPAEDEENFIETMDFLCRNRHLMGGPPGLSLCVMFRGSRLWLERGKYGIDMPKDDAAGWLKRDGSNDYKTRSRRASLVGDLAFGLFQKDAWLANSPKVMNQADLGARLEKLSPPMLLAEAAAARQPHVSASALKLLASKKRRDMLSGLELSKYGDLLAHAMSRPGNLEGLSLSEIMALATELPKDAEKKETVVTVLIDMGRYEQARTLLETCRPISDPKRKKLFSMLTRASSPHPG